MLNEPAERKWSCGKTEKRRYPGVFIFVAARARHLTVAGEAILKARRSPLAIRQTTQSWRGYGPPAADAASGACPCGGAHIKRKPPTVGAVGGSCKSVKLMWYNIHTNCIYYTTSALFVIHERTDFFMNAVIYARYSSDNQREESISAQLRAGREYCK